MGEARTSIIHGWEVTAHFGAVGNRGVKECTTALLRQPNQTKMKRTGENTQGEMFLLTSGGILPRAKCERKEEKAWVGAKDGEVGPKSQF